MNIKKKYLYLAVEVDKWNDITFLNKAKITINGNITRTAKEKPVVIGWKSQESPEF